MPQTSNCLAPTACDTKVLSALFNPIAVANPKTYITTLPVPRALIYTVSFKLPMNQRLIFSYRIWKKLLSIAGNAILTNCQSAS
jgi:hypothetical protein